MVLNLSPEAKAQLALGVDEATLPVQPVPPVQSREQELQELNEELEKAETKESSAQEEEGEGGSLDGLNSEEKAQVTAMAARDAEVRAHEQAHKAVGGALTGSISYSTEKGPDGNDYAIGGHVPIDSSPGATPEETVQKAARIQAAALAPADPSPADKSVAAGAAQMGSQARIAAADQARAEAGQLQEAQEAAAAEAGDQGAETRPQSRPPGLAKAVASYARWAA
ncbi:MAG: hypothetical protein ACI9VR_002552 [Cognaticolwellia sp.]